MRPYIAQLATVGLPEPIAACELSSGIRPAGHTSSAGHLRLRAGRTAVRRITVPYEFRGLITCERALRRFHLPAMSPSSRRPNCCELAPLTEPRAA